MAVISFLGPTYDTLEGSTPGFNYLPEFEVTLTGAGGAGASVAWAVTGLGPNPANGADFVGGVLPSGVLTFAPGETSKKISILLLGDTVFEPTEQFAVTLSNPVGATLGTAVLQVTVRDDDTSTSPLPILSSSQIVSQMEGSSGLTPYTFTFTRTGDLSGVSSATYSVLGEGASPATASDFSGGVLPSGTVQFSAGQATATVTINVLADTIVENAETFRVQLSNAIGAVLGNVTSLGSIGNDDTNAPPTIKFAPADIEGKKGLEAAFASTGVTFVLTRTGSLTGASSVNYSVVGTGGDPDQRASGADFVGGVLPSGVLTFAPGESSKTITIAVANDVLVERDENFIVMLSNPVNADLDGFVGLATILNDDTVRPTVAFATTSASVMENAPGGGFDFVVTRTGDTSSASAVLYSVTGTGANPATGADFVGGQLPTNSVSFAAGETSKVIHIGVVNDNLKEADETFTISLIAANGATIGAASTASAVIGNDDPGPTTIGFSTGWADAPEGAGGVSYVITRTGDLSGVSTVAWRAEGSGPPEARANAADFGGVNPSGVVTFAAGETSKTIFVPFANDTVVEADELFSLYLSSPTGAVLGMETSIGSIHNDDVAQPAPTIAFDMSYVSGVSATEAVYGANGVTFVLNRTGSLSSASSVNYRVIGSGGEPDERANGADFVGGVLPSGVLTFAPGESSKTITIGVVNDSVTERDEHFIVELSNAVNANLTPYVGLATILNDDGGAPPQLDMLITQVSGPENGPGVNFLVSRTGGLAGASTVAYAVTGTGAAPAGAADFAGGAMPTGTISFASGESSKVIHIDFANDALVEPDETFTLTLTSPVGATIGVASGIGKIVNDDTSTAPSLSISAVTPSKPEGEAEMNWFEFVVTRSGDTSGTASVDYKVAGSGASPIDNADLFAGMPVSGHVEFAAGESSKSISVYIRGDRMAEPNETFSVTLSNAKGASLGAASATATVLNDDTSTLPMISIPRYNFGNIEGTTFTGYVIYRSGDLSGSSTVDYAVGPPAAEYPAATAADFLGGVLPRGTVTFAPGQSSATIYFTSFDDTLAETSEAFTLQLTNAVGATLGDYIAFGQINNSDENGPDYTGAQIGLSTSSAAGTEGGPGLDFTVVRTGGVNSQSSVSFQVAGSSATPAVAADFAGGTLPSGVITFAAGETSKTIHIALADDAVVEGDEGFTLTLSSAVGASLGASRATGVIHDNDQPTSPGPGAGPGPSDPGTSNPGTDPGTSGPGTGVNNPPPAPAEHLASAYETILRSEASGGDAAWAASLADKVTKGELTEAQAIAQIIPKADATTSVASLAYQFFTGTTPTAAGFDYLVSPDGANPNNLNSAYYQSFGLENRYINFAVNLGKLGAGKAGFEAQYGAKDLFEATKAAYTTIFGAAPTDAKVHLLLDTSFVLNGQTMTRAEYFAYYGQDGANGVGTKAAMVGWLLAEAEKADIGMYAKANAAFLADLADGGAFAVDIVGVYGRPEYAYIG